MVVAHDRKKAVLYKSSLDKLIDPSWSTVIMTIDNNDPKEWKEKYRRTPLEEEKLTWKEIFQDISNPLKILIVCDTHSFNQLRDQIVLIIGKNMD